MTSKRLGISKSGRTAGLAAGCAALLLASCGGGSSSPAPPTAGVTPTPTPPPASACSLRARQNWALGQLQEWYLFPELFNAAANPASYGSLQAYVDALVAPARAQYRDRYFTYVTSISEENAYYEQGETAGFGIRLSLDSANRLTVSEAFEGGPALAAGIDRGTEITHIGTSASTLRPVGELIANGTLFDALGPDIAGTTRTMTIDTPGFGARTVTVSKTDYELDPVSDRYGAQIIDDGGRMVGYVNLRTFIGTAAPDLRAAFAGFKAQGVTEVIVDLRYNGGGLISIAELMGDLLGDGRAGQIFSYTNFRSSKAIYNESYRFHPQPESIAPTRIAFIGTESTASASELVINGMAPYLGTDMALIGGNTYGKPVGQIALDMPECDDRLRAVALKIENADHEGEYYNGLASTLPVTCQATDDIAHQLGDPEEAMIAAALDFLAGRGCAPISASASRTASVSPVGAPRASRALAPEVPRNTFQREVPGAF